MADFDLVILGGGSGGYAAALRASQLGQKVVLIEKEKLGGTCLHKGCIPTKALLHAGEIADSTRHAADFGVKADFHSMDMAAVNTYKDGVIAKLHKGLEGLVKSRNVTYVQGSGKLVSNNTVEANGTKYTGKNVILATGSYPKTLPGLEIDGKQIITSEQAIKLDYVPKSVIVLGGGVIGCEFASVWKSFAAIAGAHVQVTCSRLEVDVAAVVVRVRIRPGHHDHASRVGDVGVGRHGVARQIVGARAGVVDVELAVGRVVGVEGHAEQALLVARRSAASDDRIDVQERGGTEGRGGTKVDDAHATGLLQHEEAGLIAGRMADPRGVHEPGADDLLGLDRGRAGKGRGGDSQDGQRGDGGSHGSVCRVRGRTAGRSRTD